MACRLFKKLSYAIMDAFSINLKNILRVVFCLFTLSALGSRKKYLYRKSRKLRIINANKRPELDHVTQATQRKQKKNT